MVAHVVIPALWEAEAGGDLEMSLANILRLLSLLIFFFFYISRAWWHAPVVPATWEAGVGEWLEPRSLMLQ